MGLAQRTATQADRPRPARAVVEVGAGASPEGTPIGPKSKGSRALFSPRTQGNNAVRRQALKPLNTTTGLNRRHVGTHVKLALIRGWRRREHDQARYFAGLPRLCRPTSLRPVAAIAGRPKNRGHAVRLATLAHGPERVAHVCEHRPDRPLVPRVLSSGSIRQGGRMKRSDARGTILVAGVPAANDG